MTSLAFMAAARIRTSAVVGARSIAEGVGTEMFRWRFERALTERQSFGSKGEICHAEDGIVLDDESSAVGGSDNDHWKIEQESSKCSEHQVNGQIV
jgi:hypothetical protein